METVSSSTPVSLESEVIKTDVAITAENSNIKQEVPEPFEGSDEDSDYKYNSYDEGSDSDGFVRREPINVAPFVKVKLVEPKKKNRVCEICNKTFKTGKELRTHLRVHTNERPYKCTVCVKAFKQPSALSDHLATHTGARKHKCEVCSFAFTTSSALKRHIRKIHESSKTYKCVLCSDVFISITLLKEHRENHMRVTGSTEIINRENGKRTFRCGVCNKSFAKKEILFRHLELHLNKIVNCEYCNLPFPTDVALKSHKKINHNHIVCSICNAEYQNKRFFNVHERDHFRDVKKNACDYCQEIYEKPEDMTVHMQIEHIKTEIPSVCTICYKCFTSEKHLRFHQSLSHITCNKCVECFANETQLKIHDILKHKRGLHRCKKCPLVFRTKSRLVFHMNLTHLIISRFKCKLCKKSFSRYRHLYLHTKTHSNLGNFCKTIAKGNGNKLYQCNLCKQEYVIKAYFYKHFVTQHSGTIAAEKKHKCSQCSKMFYFKYHLQKHMSIHNSVRSFKCNLCDASYRLESSLMSHITKIHEDIKEIPCKICGLVVNGNFKLKKHIIKIHKQHFCNNTVCFFEYFNTKSELMDHKLLVHSNRFYCKICNKDFSKKVYRTHNFKFHRAEIVITTHICNLCGLVCFSPSGLNLHKYRKHQETLSLNVIAKFDSLRIKCELCNKICPNKNRLSAHMKMHERNSNTEELMCKICDKAFKKKSGLVWHVKKLHSGTNQVITTKDESKQETSKIIQRLCNFCDKSFKSSSGLRKHIKTKHSNPVTLAEISVKEEVSYDMELDF